MNALVDRADPDASIRRLMRHIEEHPADAAAAHERIASCYGNMPGHRFSHDYAIDHYRRAYALDPENSDVLRGWANCPVVDPGTAAELRELARALDERSGRSPPGDPRDREGWDRHWRFELADEHGEDGWCFHELAPLLVPALVRGGLRTILDVGAGISVEPAAFAWAGFAVTPLELSPVAVEHARAQHFTVEDAVHFFGEHPAPMHRSDGSLAHVAGDFLDPATCPGPFDVVLSRRTIQYYRGEVLPAVMEAVMEALIGRLADPGLLVLHTHNARDVDHAIEPWLRQRGFIVGRIDAERPVQGGTLARRVALLLATSG